MTPTPIAVTTKKTEPEGILLVDKPQGPTSHDAVASTRREFSTRRVGHAGTLDPMATGLLVLGLGRGTKLLTFAVGLEKTYLATVRLGVSTTTDDAEGEPIATTGWELNFEALQHGIDTLTGDLMQVPAAVSAIKVAGKRAYARVRDGEDVELAPRRVRVSRFDVVGEPRVTVVDGQPMVDVDVIVECSSGTYIRALARDLGADLGCGGHLTRLRRTSVGPWNVAEVNGELIPLGAACLALAPDPIVIDETEADRFRHGVAPYAEREVFEESRLITVVSGEQVLGLIGRDGDKIKVLFNINPA